MRRLLLITLVLACDANADHEPPAAAPRSAAEPKAAAQTQSVATPGSEDAAARPVALASNDAPAQLDTTALRPRNGPAAHGAVGVTSAQRETAVLELLEGAASVHRLPLVDVDPGKTFTEDLRDRVAPYEVGGPSLHVRAQTATVGPGLHRDLVRRVVRSHMHELRECYWGGVIRKKGLRGMVVVTFTIAPAGDVTRATIERSTLSGKAGNHVEACIVAAAGSWRFPGPTDGVSVDVVFPFDLTIE